METKTQVTVRLSTANVQHIDEQVNAGRAASRAAYLDKLADMERRRTLALQDAALYMALASDPDPDPDDWTGLAAWGARQLVDLDEDSERD